MTREKPSIHHFNPQESPGNNTSFRKIFRDKTLGILLASSSALLPISGSANLIENTRKHTLSLKKDLSGSINVNSLKEWNSLMDDMFVIEIVSREDFRKMKGDFLKQGKLFLPKDLQDSECVGIIKHLLDRLPLQEISRQNELKWLRWELQARLRQSLSRLKKTEDSVKRSELQATIKKIYVMAEKLGFTIRNDQKKDTISLTSEGNLEEIYKKAFFRLLYLQGREKLGNIDTWSQDDVSQGTPEIQEMYKNVKSELEEHSQKIAQITKLEETKIQIEQAMKEGNTSEVARIQKEFLVRLARAMSYFPSSRQASRKEGNSLVYMRNNRDVICTGQVIIASQFLDILNIPHQFFCPQEHIALIAQLSNGDKYYYDAVKLRFPVDISSFPRITEGWSERIVGLNQYWVDEVGTRGETNKGAISSIFVNRGYNLVSSWDYQWAIKNYQEAVKWNATNVDALNGVGVCLIKLKRNKEALTILKRAHEINPTNYLVVYNLYCVAQKLKLSDASSYYILYENLKTKSIN